MAKLAEIYLATCIETKIRFVIKEDEKLDSSCVGKTGFLSIYISEHKDVGRPYIVFTTSNSVLQTSTGDMDVDIEKMQIAIYKSRSAEECRRRGHCSGVD